MAGITWTHVDTLDYQDGGGIHVYELSETVTSPYNERDYLHVAVSRSIMGRPETAVFGVVDGACNFDDVIMIWGHVSDEEALSQL